MAGGVGGVELDVEHALGDNATGACAGEAGVLDGVFEEEEDAGFGAGVAFVDEDGALLEQVAMALEGAVDDGVEEGMAGADEGCGGMVVAGGEGFFEGDAFVAAQDGQAGADGAFDVADGGGDVGDLVAAAFALAGAATDALEGFEEEGLDVVGLEAAGFGALHAGAHAVDAAGIHCVGRQGALFEQLAQFLGIEGVFDGGGEAGAHFRLFAVADGIDEQLAQGPAIELHFAEHVEYLAAEGLARLLQFFQQALVYVALARLGGDQVPEVADLGLADAVDTAEALLEAVGVPGQVIVDHEVGALEVDAFAGGVGGEEDAHLGVVAERFLGGMALLAAQAAVDGDDGLFASQAAGDAGMQIVESIAVFGEDDQFLLGRGHGVRNFA